MMNLLDEYRARDLLQDATEGVSEHLLEAPRTIYIGFDPTAPSLHLGSLVPIMGLRNPSDYLLPPVAESARACDGSST